MKKPVLMLCVALSLAPSIFAQINASVQLKLQEELDRVEVWMDGELFTSYRFYAALEKPVLYPIYAPDGLPVTRGFPIAPREKERVDHPHHVGLWFNFGDVNGYDFWNNSNAVAEERKGAYGRIVHRTVEQAETVGELGVLKVRMDWVAPDNAYSIRMLEESATYLFRGSEGVWMVDRITRLTAVADRVEFTDNKEGMLAIRVDRAFELPPEVSDGVAALDKEGLTGWYLNSEGDQGREVWGKRARWVRLTGTRGGSACSLILMDHPENISYPSCWHARDYGLFSINNLGRQVYNRELDKFHLLLKKGESLSFRHRFVVASGELNRQEIEAIFKDFSAR
ncbi:MAG: PmoA family protein [Bacteroidales bacterium]|nr:PmoA family protein [Bacteroidales bacterium]